MSGERLTMRGFQAMKLLEQGVSRDEVAERTGLSEVSVWKYAKKLGLVTRRCEPRDWAPVQAALDDGLTYRDVAEKTGVPIGSLNDALRRGVVTSGRYRASVTREKLRQTLGNHPDVDALVEVLWKGLRK
ncbi:hypothetical protein [Brevundimonas sp. NPDC058933]|uniref:hypothetical protein n=1 Tax=Brevundimonas sp. NPDC058933 TaxID=3346673 RepID=UPI003BEF1932